MTSIRWYSFPKDILPDALLSFHFPEKLGGSRVSHPDQNPDGITLGYCDDEYFSDYNPPAILALPDAKPAELMAWLKTYAPDTSPLSQFARVIKSKEINTYNITQKNKPTRNSYLNRWPSVILGEILAQGEMEISIETLPLSRSLASYSNTIARATACHYDEQHKKSCIERLEIAEADKNFVSRALTVQGLKPIWEKISTSWNEHDNITNIVYLFDHSSNLKTDLFSSGTAFSHPSAYSDLLSDSIESRVLAYRRIISEELESNFLPLKESAAAKIAIAAFLVGRSTSHMFLLKTVAKKIPSVYVWFGLIAGIVGPTYWEVDWARATKGIEKNLRTKLDWSEPNQSDLSWTEYEWLTSTFRNISPFTEMPKQLPKVLSIEVIPGAACQFRLALDKNGATGKNAASDADAHELNALKSLLSDFYSLAEKVKKQLSNSESTGRAISTNEYPTKPYSKRPKKNLGDSGTPKSK